MSFMLGTAIYIRLFYDANVPGEREKTEAFGAEILKLCFEVGGVLTGEHGGRGKARSDAGNVY